MLNQFSRTQLLLGPEAMEHLAQCRVAVFGVGGVGGYTVEALVRSGIGALDLIDDDKVCLTNLNRQIYATLGFTPLQCIQKSRKIRTYGIITVHNLKVEAGGMF